MAKKGTKSKGQSALDEALSQSATETFDPSTLGAVERPKGLKTVVDSMAWWKFGGDQGKPVFVGHFVEKVLAQKDDKSKQRKKGDVMGYLFVQDGTEREFALPNSHAITQGLEAEGWNKKTKFWIEFQGKVAGGNGKNPYNRFYVAKF